MVAEERGLWSRVTHPEFFQFVLFTPEPVGNSISMLAVVQTVP